MKEAILPDICRIQYGFAFDSAQFSATTGTPLIRIRDVVRGYSETYTTEQYSEEYVVNNGDLLIGMDGEFNIARWKGGPALLNQRVCRLFPKDNIVDKSYLFYFMPQALKRIEDKTPFVTVKHLSAKQLNSVVVPLPALEKQMQIASTLNRLNSLISLRKQQLAKLDELVKARFVEMFGDPEINPYCWERVTVSDVCSSIVRGPFGSALKKEFFVPPNSSTYKVYEQKHAIQKSATIGTYYITKEKYEELHRFECVAGDILMSCSGTMGELYQLPVGCNKGIINQALCKFTLNERILPVVFLTSMRQTIGNLEVKGSGIQNIAAVSYVKALPINLPPLNLQQQFADFVAQTDRQKLTIQQSLDKLEVLKKSLMQEYFG